MNREFEVLCSRLDRLRGLSGSAGYSAMVLCDPMHVRYFTGVVTSGTVGFLVVRRDSIHLVAAQGVRGIDGVQALGVELVEYESYSPRRLVDPAVEAEAKLARLMSAMTGIVAAEVRRLPIQVARLMGSADFVDVEPRIQAWRTVKDGLEVDRLRHRVSLLERAFTAVAERLASGCTEIEVECVVKAVLSEEAAETIEMRSNIAAGSRTLEDDPQASTRVIGTDEAVLVDLYPRIDGYVADLTRMFVPRGSSSTQRSMLEVAVGARDAAEARLGPGVSVSEIDHAVRSHLSGFGSWVPTLPHHVGHGIGLAAWEAPWIGGDSTEVLEPGNVVAIEPGVYLAGVGGVRIESNYLVTDGGYERLDSTPPWIEIG
jgi:Xaa-Pro aminopeptidase